MTENDLTPLERHQAIQKYLKENAEMLEKENAEISDEEIEKGAEDWQEFRQGAGKQSFEAGAKWYREQLKKL
jgi:S-adenosylmethionine synthetase